MKKQTQPEKKIFVLRDRGGDVTKNWYIEILVNGKRLEKKYAGINSSPDPNKRRVNAKALIRKLKKEHQQIAACIDERKALFDALRAHQHLFRKKTYQTYFSKLNILFKWIGPGDLTTDQLRRYFEEYRRTHTQQGTYDTRIKLKAVFKLAGLEHLLEPIKITKGNSQPLKYFQKHQRRKILSYLEKTNPQLFLHCLFIYFTGIRPRSELRKIKVGDIEWEKGRISVSGEFSKNHKTQFVGLCKNFLPYLQHLKELPPAQYIFHRKKDKFRPAGQNTYGEWFREALDGMGYSKEYQLYSWKHTGAMEVYQATKDIVALQHWARHADIRTTQLYIRQLGIEDFGDFYDRFPSPF